MTPAQPHLLQSTPNPNTCAYREAICHSIDPCEFQDFSRIEKGDIGYPDCNPDCCASHSSAPDAEKVLEDESILRLKLSECQRGREALRQSIAQATIDLDAIQKEVAELRQQEREQE
jgi:hypothetical protein